MTEYKEVLPCGILKIQDMVYWLLSPYPIEPDSWQRSEQQRFSVVPFNGNLQVLNGTTKTVYGYARHIVCTDPLIEYRSADKILVEQLDFNLVNQIDSGVPIEDEFNKRIDEYHKDLADVFSFIRWSTK